jgi:molecular chaperone GrpE
LVSLLPVLDDFERCLKELHKSENTELIKGIELIHSKFSETLKNKGLTKMEIKQGDDFDLDKHEAITQIPSPNEELHNKIIDTVENGYLLGDKVVRYAKVIIGK